MITKRIIPCLDVKNGRVVKGVNFEGLSDVSSPVELARYYSENGADELVFYDITASAEGRELFTDILTEVASKIFIPLTVGGGINTLADFDRVLSLNLLEAAAAVRAAARNCANVFSTFVATHWRSRTSPLQSARLSTSSRQVLRSQSDSMSRASASRTRPPTPFSPLCGN